MLYVSERKRREQADRITVSKEIAKVRGEKQDKNVGTFKHKFFIK